MKPILPSLNSRSLLAPFTVLLLLIAFSGPLRAQSKGVLWGEVTDTASGAPLAGASVKAQLESDTTFVRMTYTNGVGKYHFGTLQSGKYRVTYSMLGYEPVTTEAQVAGADPTMLHMVLAEKPVGSDEVVITASRHEEKATDAPASISIVNAVDIKEHVSAVPTDMLANVPGMDVTREGIAMSNYSSRSMHSVFGSDVLTMNDYHSMEVPAIGGFYGILMPQTPDDIDHIEVVRGPGSALYGPDAATGVVHFISKSPFSSQGTSVALTGGERNYFDAAFRHAQALSDNIAFKVSGHYLRANDWQIADDWKEDTARKHAQAALQQTGWTASQRDSLNRIGARDTALALYTVEARMDAILSDDMTVNLTGGLTNIINDIALTEDFGGAQVKNWQYMFGQARWSYKDLFVQADVNHNNMTESYFLPTGAKVSDHSLTYNLQLQHRYSPMQNELLTYGADYRAIRPNTDSTLYGPEDGHANVSIYGAYLQSQTNLLDNSMELVLAARVDKLADAHDLVKDPIFSPRAAVVYHLTPEHLVRAMYNETYLFPSENKMFADIISSTDAYDVGALGIPTTNARYVSPYVSGLHFQQNALGSYNMYSQFAPGTPIPSNMAAGALWVALMQIAAGQSAANLAGTPLAPFAPAVKAALQNLAKPGSQVSSYLAYLNINPATSKTMPIIPTASPLDISPVSPQHQRSFEVDYQGSLSKTFQFEVDAYQTHYTSIVASTVALTPSVFLSGAQLQQYLVNDAHLADSLIANGVPAQYAAFLADTLSKSIASTAGSLPLGVVQPVGQPTNEMHPNDLLVGSRSYLNNSVEFYGVDVQAGYKASDMWEFTFGGSWLNKNYWEPSELDNTKDSVLQSPFALNMPKYRASVSAKYSGLTKGMSVELRDRWSDAFKMFDNYYLYAGDVHARNVIDMTLNYRPDNPAWKNLLLTLSVQNLLDYKHQEFVGAPTVGRLTVLRAAYTLPSL